MKKALTTRLYKEKRTKIAIKRMTRIFLVFCIAITLIHCDKSESPPGGTIDFQKLNKTINYLNSDSIDGVCKDLIFEIHYLDQNLYSAIISLNDAVISCDGFNNIVVNPASNKVEVLEQNMKIFENNNWGSAKDVCLDNFAGKGEKYIGYRSGLYPLSVNSYYYGWIKIDLSEDKQTLKIISRATYLSGNIAIAAGQR